MPRPTQKQLFDELLAKFGPEVAQAFMQATAEVRSGVNLQALIAAIEQRDIERAIRILNLDPAAYVQLEEKIREAFVAGARAGVQTLPASIGVGFYFNMSDPGAVAWLRDHSSLLITRIVETQLKGIRAYLIDAMETGAHPRTAGLNIVGRINRATRMREGGILGLSAPQERALTRARAELASGDPAQLRAYLQRKSRDRRFDPTIRKAIAAKKPIPAEIAKNAATAYSNGLLKRRGEIIGRTESLTAVRASKHQAYEQLVASGKVEANTIRRTWLSAGDNRVRHTHSDLNGSTVGLNEAYQSPSGARLRYPGDTSLGAPAEEIIGCRCDVIYRVVTLPNMR